MQKLAFVMILAGFAVGSLWAQGPEGASRSSLGVSAGVSTPTSTFGKTVGIGFGGAVQFQYQFQRMVAFTGSLGYMYWTEKERVELGSNSVKSKAGAFQALVGFKYYFIERFYGLAEGGYSALTYTVKSTIGSNPTTELTPSDNEFVFALGAGALFKPFDVEAKYFVLHPDLTNFVFSVGYTFDL